MPSDQRNMGRASHQRSRRNVLHPIRGIAVLHNSSDMIQHDLTVAGPRISLGQHKFIESIG